MGFVAYGPILDGDTTFSETGTYMVRIRNLSTNQVICETARKDRYFATAFVDLNRKPVIRAGDEIEVAVFDGDNKLCQAPSSIRLHRIQSRMHC